MKKLMKICLIAGALALIMCVGALANGDTAGLDNAAVENAFKDVIAVDTAEETATVTCTNAIAGSDYVIIVMTDATGIPTEENIAYIDQKRADSATVSFTVYPKSLEPDAQYYVYMSSNAPQTSANDIGALVRVASFEYYVPYILGDADGNRTVNATDALYVLQAIVGEHELTPMQLLAADMDLDGVVTASDALLILQAVVG
ncbi:MAG: dockerin type I repeat-containing protein [Clostridia bacterium]|nr:dockerin type I repeat-containing protein [Clostridia bacterium]